MGSTFKMNKFEDEKYKKLVSIIMPAYNCAEYISASIESVCNQIYNNWELIIIDDCSTDGTQLVVENYLKRDSRIKYYRFEQNQGAAIARNKAIELASGKYLAFLDSDDLWLPHKLDVQIEFMKDNKCTFTCTSYEKIDDEGNKINKVIKARKKSDYDAILRTCPGNSTVMYDAEILGKFFILNIRKRNDYVMWLQVIRKANVLYGVEEVLGSHRIRSNAISSKKTSLIKYHWKVYRDIENLTLLKSSFLIVYWVIYTVFKLR